MHGLRKYTGPSYFRRRRMALLRRRRPQRRPLARRFSDQQVAPRLFLRIHGYEQKDAVHTVPQHPAPFRMVSRIPFRTILVERHGTFKPIRLPQRVHQSNSPGSVCPPQSARGCIKVAGRNAAGAHGCGLLCRLSPLRLLADARGNFGYV